LIRNALRPVARRDAAAVAAELRKIYTAPTAEARGHFPGDDAVVKLLWLADWVRLRIPGSDGPHPVDRSYGRSS
jgi:transposase-like protein